MQESQWQKKKKRKRSQSRNPGQDSQNGAAALAKQESSSKSMLERLQSVVTRLQSRTCPVDLRNDGPAWVKLATQVVTKDDCSLEEGCLAACLVTHLLRRCTSSPDGIQAGTGNKLQMNPQHMLPFAKAVASRVSPSAELHLPHLALLSQLMVAHPGVCISLRAQLEENLLPWLNYPYSPTGETLAASGNPLAPPTSSAVVSLAGDVWALLPIASPAGSADNDEVQGARGTKGGGLRGARVAAARGAQLQLLMEALQGQLDLLLAGVVQIQGTRAAKAGTEALRIPPIVDQSHTPGSGASKKSKKLKQTKKAAPAAAATADPATTDCISDPILMVEVAVCRCSNLLVFVDRLLRSVGSGSNPYGVTVAPKTLLGPLMRILQVSPGSLQRYTTTEVRRLSQLWPRLHRAALTTLATTITTLDHNLALWYPELQRQLESTLMAAKQAPSNKMAAAAKAASNKMSASGGKQAPVNKMASKDASTNKMAAAAAAVKEASLNKMAATDCVTDLQDTVRLLYKCMTLLMEVSRGTTPVSPDLLKVVMQDLTVQPSTLITLQNLSRKSIANMSIKKKSKKKGYTIVPKLITPSCASDDADTQVPLSLELSHGIVYYALELLERVAASPTSHYTLTVDCARVLHQELPKVARYFVSEWRSFPHTLTGTRLYRDGDGSLYPGTPVGSDLTRGCGGLEAVRGGGGVCYDSISGRTDLRCLFMGPALIEKLIRLVGMLGTGGTPVLPPHCTQLLHLLHHSALLLPCSQLRTAAEGGTRSLRHLLAHPRLATYAQAVEDVRAAAFSAAAVAAENGGGSAASSDGGDGGGDSDESDDGGEESNASDDGDGDNNESDDDSCHVASVSDDEDGDEEMGGIKEINGNEEEMNGDAGAVPDAEEEMNGVEETVRSNGNSQAEADEAPEKGPSRLRSEATALEAGVAPPTAREGGKGGGNETCLQAPAKKRRRVSKKSKKSAGLKPETQELNARAGGQSPSPNGEVPPSPSGSGECLGDLSVDQMLAELAD